MNIHFTPTIPKVGNWKWLFAVASLALGAAASTIMLQTTTEGGTLAPASLAPQAGQYAPTSRSEQHDRNGDYRIYVVASQEQADRQRSILSELENPQSESAESQVTWNHEIVVLESAEAERKFERNLADLNESRVAFGYGEIWVVDMRSVL